MISEVAQRYGQGLYEVALENGSIKEKKDQVEGLLSVLNGNKEVEELLRAVKVTKNEKKEFIENVFGDNLDKEVISLIKLLIDKGRIYYLKDVLKEYLVLADEELGIVHATVHSARKLKDDDIERIKEALRIKTNKEVVIENKVDASLIAGIKVTLGNNVTDITMKSKIEKMKETLLKGGQA